MKRFSSFWKTISRSAADTLNFLICISFGQTASETFWVLGIYFYWRGILYKYVLYCWGYSILEEHFILSFILYIVCCAIWAQMNGGVGNNGKRHSGVNNTVNVYYIQRGENHETCHQWPGLFNASAVFSFALSPSLFCYIMSGAGRARESRNTHSPTKRDWGTPSGDFFFSLSHSIFSL
jgi:hypothetical protein